MANIGTLTAIIGLDVKDFQKGVSSVEDMTKKLATGVGASMGAVTTAVGAAVGAAATGLVKLTESAVKSYADYEQLVGGVETLFNESAGIVEDYAMNAYKTAGISANEYMSTVTSFSASLLQSLGGDTEAAASLADQAITDMADNANKMGTDMAAIQNAYQGFAKQNYTMLDNLKLGYGGTQAEMERLIRDAEKLDATFKVNHTTVTKNKKTVDEINYSFADMVKAIHIIQDELDITGTTAKEAEHTISGSLNMLKASWQDLMTSLAGGGKGLSESISALVDSAQIFMTNAVPVIIEALYGIGDLIMQLVPIIAERLPDLISTLVPILVETAVYIVQAIVENLPLLVEVIAAALIENLPLLVEAIIATLDVLLSSILPTLLEVAFQLVMSLAQGLLDNMDLLMESVTNLIIMAITTIIQHLPEFIEMGFQIVLKIIEGILMAIPRLLKAVGEVLGIFDKGSKDIDKSTKEVDTSFGVHSNSIADNASTLSRDYETSLNRMIDTNNAFKRSTESTNEAAKKVTVNVYDANGNITRSFETTANTVTKTTNDMAQDTEQKQRYIADALKSVSDSSEDASSSVESAMNDVAKSAESAASAVESAVDRMNSALGSISGGELLISARASGGPVSAGVPYMTGEEGRELFVPATDGYILNNDDTESLMAQAGGVTVIIQGDVYDDERSMKQKLSDAIISVLQEQVAYA